MKMRARKLRGAVSAPLAALMLALSVSVPLMERAELGQGSVLESEHDPAACLPAHDHTICTQVGANQAAPMAPATSRAAPATLRLLAPTTSAPPPTPLFQRGPPSRAPPSV